MTEQEAKETVFGEIAQVYDGYRTRCEPITGRPFMTFKGIGITREGDPPAEGSVQASPEEALRVHSETLAEWLKTELPRYQSPVVLVRRYPQVLGGKFREGWVAWSRLLVVEGNRDVKEKFALHSGIGSFKLRGEPISQVRGIVCPEGGLVIGSVQ